MLERTVHPDDVSLLLDFLNTVDFEQGTDVLADRAGWHEWTRERGLRPDALAAATRTRDALRGAVGDSPPPEAATDVSVRIELADAIPVMMPATAVAGVFAAAARLAVLDEWKRVKICPADDCRLAFYDRSRNRSRTWCSMNICGNRTKARAWRERQGEP